MEKGSSKVMGRNLSDIGLSVGLRIVTINTWDCASKEAESCSVQGVARQATGSGEV